MGTVMNGNKLSGVCINGKTVKGLAKNGVVFYKKETTPSVSYKRRIMAEDDLLGKTVYNDFPDDFYTEINKKGQELCNKYGLNYDGQENPFIS